MGSEFLSPTEAEYYNRAFRLEIVPRLAEIKGLDGLGRSRFSLRTVVERVKAKSIIAAVVIGITLSSGIGERVFDYALSVFDDSKITQASSNSSLQPRG